MVSFRGEAPLFSYACGRNSSAISMMARAIVNQDGLSQSPDAKQMEFELWDILREFSMGYAAHAEERLGLVSKQSIMEKFNMPVVNALCTGRLRRDVTALFSDPALAPSFNSVFGEVKSASLDVWQDTQPDRFTVVFSLFVQGQITHGREDGSVLCIQPTHLRMLATPPLMADAPYIASTPKASGAVCISDILPDNDALRAIRLNFLLWRRESTLIIADVTGSFQ
jgi:hypothetical protein